MNNNLIFISKNVKRKFYYPFRDISEDLNCEHYFFSGEKINELKERIKDSKLIVMPFGVSETKNFFYKIGYFHGQNRKVLVVDTKKQFIYKHSLFQCYFLQSSVKEFPEKFLSIYPFLLNDDKEGLWFHLATEVAASFNKFISSKVDLILESPFREKIKNKEHPLLLPDTEIKRISLTNILLNPYDHKNDIRNYSRMNKSQHEEISQLKSIEYYFLENQKAHNLTHKKLKSFKEKMITKDDLLNLLEQKKVSENDLSKIVNAIKNLLDEIIPQSTIAAMNHWQQTKSKLNSDIEHKDKLKLVIPLLFLKYEREVSIKNLKLIERIFDFFTKGTEQRPLDDF